MNPKIVLLTGASSGIGKSTAIKLLQSGYIVYGAARRIERMKELEGLGARTISMDVTDDQSMIEGVNTIFDEQGQVDILINNAGYGCYGAIEDVGLQEAKRQFEVNLFGLARLTQLVLPHMRENHYGKIVNISSMGGKIYTPLGGWYHATKHAVEGFSDCLRIEVKPFGIDVIIIEPGAIKTEWSDLAVDSISQNSGKTAYAGIARKAAEIYANTYQNPHVSSPEVVADVIYNALIAKNPKTRYAVGYMAKTYLLLRRIISDKLYDKILISMIKG